MVHSKLREYTNDEADSFLGYACPYLNHCFTYLDEGGGIIVTIICACLRNLSRPMFKLQALDLLVAVGLRLPDDYKLDRIVPYLITTLTDPVPLVRSIALRTLTVVVRRIRWIYLADC